MKILVVEDNRFVMSNHQVMADCLCDENILPNLSFDFAENYPQATRWLLSDIAADHKNRIHAIISDFEFPFNALDQRRGGIEFFRAVVTKYEGENRLPPLFYYLSGSSALDIRQELTEAGISKQPNDFFDKSAHTLFHVMNTIRQSCLDLTRRTSHQAAIAA